MLKHKMLTALMRRLDAVLFDQLLTGRMLLLQAFPPFWPYRLDSSQSPGFDLGLGTSPKIALRSQ